MTPLISICIPTYNGEKVLSETLRSILRQGNGEVEIVICDDCSTDRTVEIAQAISGNYPQIRVFRNPKNLGMDRNFAQSVRHSTGKYIWFSGQDDIFEAGAVDKIHAVLDAHPDVGLIYFNYRFMSGDLQREIAPPILDIPDDYYVDGAEAYFSAVDSAPSFLPATVIQRSLWDAVSIEKFYDTHYVQVAVWLMSLNKTKTYIISDARLISCRVPEDSWKYTGGQMLFETITGKFWVYKSVNAMDPQLVPTRILDCFRNDFFNRMFRMTIVMKSMGMRPTSRLISQLRYLVDHSAYYYLGILPVMFLPQWLARVVMFFYSRNRRKKNECTNT